MSVNKVEVNGVEHEINDARLNPLSKTPQMTTPVGLDASGRLFAQPSSSEEVEASVAAWLEEHPEATTTIADGSITKVKLASELIDELTETDDTMTLEGVAADAKKVGELFAEASAYTDEQVADAVSDMSDAVGVNTAEIATQKARIDSIVALPAGSTTSDAELVDIRTGCRGEGYASAGEAVRSQAADIYNLLGFDTSTDLVWANKTISTSSGTYSGGAGKRIATRHFIATKGTVISTDDENIRFWVARYNLANGEFKGSVSNPWTTQYVVTEDEEIAICARIVGDETISNIPATGAKIEVEIETVRQNKRLKVLFIGNSFTQDVCAYLPPIWKEAAPDTDLTICTLYLSGARLSKHVEMFDNDTPYTVTNYWSPELVKWRRYSVGSTVRPPKTLKQAIAMEDWDLVVIQNITDDVEGETAINNMIASGRELMRKIQPLFVKPVKFMFLVTSAREDVKVAHTYTEDEIYGLSVDMMDAVDNKLGVSDFFSILASIQSARTNSTLQAIGADGNMLYDGKHLQAGLPALIGCYTVAEKLFDVFGIASGVYGSKWRPTLENCLAINATAYDSETGEYHGMTHGNSLGLDEDNVLLAQELAVMAVKKPTTIFDCSDLI